MQYKCAKGVLSAALRRFRAAGKLARTLPAASLFITDIGLDWGQVMVMGSLIAIPPLIFMWVTARPIITGLPAGAVKG